MTDPMPIVIINLWEPTAECAICGEECSTEFNVAQNEDGRIVDGDEDEDWIGRAVCKSCFDKANSGEITHVW